MRDQSNGARLVPVGRVLAHCAEAVAAMVRRDHMIEQMRVERSLREAAVAAASGRHEPYELANLFAAHLSAVFAPAAATVVRFDDGRTPIVAAHVSGERDEAIALREPAVLSEVARTGKTTHRDYRHEQRHPTDTSSTNWRRAIAVPIRHRHTLWGALALIAQRRASLPNDTTEQLEQFALLISYALANADTLADLQRQAITDGLTGLLNHRGFHDQLKREWHRAQRHNHPLALVLFDIDDFKQINDTHGHHAGDQALKTVATVLHEQSRVEDAAARIGGDEFALIAPDNDLALAAELADRLREQITAQISTLGISSTVSAGVSDIRTTAPHDLLAAADAALYNAKNRGRNLTATAVRPPNTATGG